MSDLFAQLEQKNGLPSGLLDAVWSAESSRGENMQSPKGAQGHFQFMPATAQQYGLDDPNNLQKSAKAAARMLSDMMQQTGSVPGALAAYNWGIGNVQRKGMEAAPAETRNYIQKVTANMPQQSDPFAELNKEFSQTAPAQQQEDPFAELNKEFSAAPPPQQSTVQVAQPQQESATSQTTNTPPDRLKGRNWLEKGTLGAGKAVADLMEGVGLGGVLWPRGWQRAPGADSDLMSDPAGVVGNVGGQIGLAYLGGRALQGGGQAILATNAARAIPAIKTAGGLLETAGGAVINPANYKQAAGTGAVFGAISQPGDMWDRAQNAVTGAIGGSAGLAVGRGVGKIVSGVKSLVTPKGPIEMEVSAKLSQKGIDFASLPQAVKEQVVNIGKKSMADVDNLDTTQLGRMADFNATGIKPTRGWLTRDPKQWWLENNLNTVDDQLKTRFMDAQQSLLYGVRKGAGDATDYERGQVLQKSVNDYDAGLKAKADSLYQAARNTAGRDIPLDPHKFVNDASVELDQQMLGSKLPADTLSWFQKATEGKEPFDMGTAMQRLQALNGRIYSTNDRAEAVALGIVKKHLINAIDNGETAAFNPAPGMRSPDPATGSPSPSFGSDQIGGQSRLPGAAQISVGGGISPFQGSVGPAAGQAGEQASPGIAEAFRTARSAAADRFRFQEANPLIEKIIKGNYAPEDLPDIVGKMKVDQLKGLSQLEQQRGVPIMSSLQDAARAYVRDASTLQGETGGSFSINGLRKALDKIGPEKGKQLFGNDGWAEYQRILRVGGAINNPPLKPAGSTTVPNLLRFAQTLGKLPIPGARGLLDITITAAGKAKQMADVGSALNPPLSMVIPKKPQPSMLPLLMGPGLLGLSEQ